MLNGYELRRIRESRKISQNQLANVLGIYTRRIQEVESCRVEPSQALYDKWITAIYDDNTLSASKKKIHNADDMAQLQATTGIKATRMTKKRQKKEKTEQ